MKFILKLAIVTVLLLLTNCIAINQVSEEHSTVIEKNHFFSNYEINTTYQISKVDEAKPIIMYLKKKDDNQIFNNNITIQLISGDRSSECLLNSFDKMCFLNNLPTTDMSMKIRCDHLPCEASWTILQPAMKKVKEVQEVSDLFDISQSNNHMIAVVTCNNAEIKDFQKKVRAYSQNDFISGYTEEIIYYLFNKQKDGHLYFTVEEAAQSCAQMAIYNVKGAIPQGEQLKDFVLLNKSSQFKFTNRPTKEIRFDISMHELDRDPIDTALQVKIIGQRNGADEQIKTASIKPGFGTTVYDFCFVVPLISEDFSNLRVRFQSNNKILMLNFEMHEGRAQIQEAEHSHFTMKSGENIKYRIIPNENAGADQIVKIFLGNAKHVTLSKQQCSKKTGCDFQITAKSDIESLLYVGTADRSELTKNQIVFLEFTDKIKHKIHENDVVYLKKQFKKDKYFQILVNNPNVIIHAASQEKCEKPSSQCYQKVANMHNPFVYGPSKDGILLIAVQGLQNCEFTISALSQGQGAIELSNEPFAYLMDDHESSLLFKFSNPQKEGVSFNLIAPLNNLLLIVKEGKENPDPDEDTTSLEGFISYDKKSITQKQFRIMVQKTEDSKQKYVHFTLIASINGANLRLDPGVPHYETLKKKEHRDFVFQFDKSQDYLVNFYISNIASKQTLKIPLLVSTEDQWTSKTVKHFEIEQESDVLNLKDVSEQLCHEQGEVNCEIFIRLINSMGVQVDMTITLMVKDSVIQLKDGLWQSYSLNQIAQTSHFFFLPKNQHKSISIVYHSLFVDFGLMYSLWKSDQKTMNPTEWPFPTYQEDNTNKMDEYKSINHILIDSSSLKQCWPSCIVLVSLYKKKNAIGFQKGINMGSYKIMASNEVFELAEKTKLDFYLKKDEEKYIMVDLKYGLEKEALTFFRTSVLGYQTLSANVYSQKNQRCPEQFEGDFSFGSVETVIKTDTIKQKISQNDMDDDNNLYLCILAKGIMESKFNLQYTTQDQIIKVLRYDTFQTVTLTPKTPKLFQLEAWQFYEIKFTREKGYFYVKLSQCDSVKDGGYEQCLEKLQDSEDDRGKKIISKTEEFSEEPCPKCIVYFRLESDEQCSLIIHIQSKYSTVELKEKDLISDFTNQDDENKYTLTSIQYEETIINVEVTEGDPIVTVTDYGKLNISREKNSETNNIHIVIPPIQGSEDKKLQVPALGGTSYYAFGYSRTFRFLAIKIKSKNPKMPCAYTISYSSGERQTYLEDGLVTGYTLQPNQLSKFLYLNENPTPDNKGYITISMNQSATLFNLELKMYTLDDPYDEDTRKEVTPVKPPMRKKTPNPTMTFSLPSARMVSLELESAQQAKVTVMINHQEVIIVPFNQQFPFQLMKNEKINMLTDVNSIGYILVTLRKCDASEPTFGYSFNYQNFEKSEFQYTTSLQDDPKFQFYIKASAIGTLYMQLSNNDIANGLFAINLKYSETKITAGKVKSGNNGLVQYSIVDSKTALIKFNGAVCPKGKCTQNVKYYWTAGTTIQDVYTQSVCPFSYFLLLNVVSVPPLIFSEIKGSKNGNNEITFEYPLIGHVSYISIKGISDNQEFYYRPIEVVTLWGSINNSTWFYKLSVSLGIVFMLCCLLVLYRRICANNGYGKLSDNPYDYS